LSKSQFLSTMSHEIRTPMNAVIGFTHLLLQMNPREDQMEYLKILKFSAENLLVLINDILDFSKIEAGKIEFEEADFSLKQLISNTRLALLQKAVEKDIQLTGVQKDVERSKLKPEFGIRYDNMFGFGGSPMQYSLMGVVKLPMVKWSSKSSKANVISLDWKAEALNQQRQMMINAATGMSYSLQTEIVSKKKQIKVFENNIIPALRRNFQSLLLAYEQNTEELFTLYDAWETLNVTQLEYLDEVKQLLLMQVELERIREVK